MSVELEVVSRELTDEPAGGEEEAFKSMTLRSLELPSTAEVIP